MHITLRQLRLVLAIAEAGSITAAARSQHITQPTASTQLQQLARSIGMPVHETVGRRLQLTAAGRALADSARSIEHEYQSLRQRLDALKGLELGTLKVAVVSTAKYFVPRLLGEFCKLHPGIDVALEILNRDRVVERLEQRLDDLYVMSLPPSHLDLAVAVLRDNPLVVIAPAKHPLTRTKNIPLEKLSAERFILREQGSGTRMATDNHLRKCRFTPLVRMELGSNEALKEAVAGDLGIGVLSAHALATKAHMAGIKILDVKGFPIQAHWYVVSPGARSLSPAATAFKAHLLKSQTQ